MGRRRAGPGRCSLEGTWAGAIRQTSPREMGFGIPTGDPPGASHWQRVSLLKLQLHRPNEDWGSPGTGGPHLRLQSSSAGARQDLDLSRRKRAVGAQEGGASAGATGPCLCQVDYGGTAEELEAYFSHCGEVHRVTILCDKFSGRPKGSVQGLGQGHCWAQVARQPLPSPALPPPAMPT